MVDLYTPIVCIPQGMEWSYCSPAACELLRENQRLAVKKLSVRVDHRLSSNAKVMTAGFVKLRGHKR